MRIGLYLVVGLLAAAQGVQALEVSADAPAEPLQPGAAWAGSATITIDCRELLQFGTGLIAALEINYTTTNAGLSVDGDTERSIEKSRCAPDLGEISETVPFAVSGDISIAAMREERITLETQLSSEQPSTPSTQRASTDVTVQMAYLGTYEVEQVDFARTGDPQRQLEYKFKITNTGNGQSKYSFELLDELVDGAQVIVPDMVLLDEAGGMKDEATVIVTYNTPFENGQNYAEDTFRLQVNAEYSYDANLQSEQVEVLEFGATTDGLYIPGPGVILGPALLGLAFLLRRQ